MPMGRLQILLRPDQAPRLRDVARVQGVPVTELVREALDQAFPHPRAPQRQASWEQFNALPIVPAAPDPAELEALLDNRIDKQLPPG